MKLLLASDSFKGSMSAQEVVDELAEHFKGNELIKKPLADGGEGSLAILQSQVNFKKIPLQTFDAYQNSLESYYLMDEKNQIAYIETALICGVEGIPEKELNIMESSMIGLGIAIKDALSKGAKEIYFFLGGTATNDGGLGMLLGLGYTLLDDSGQVLQGKTKELGKVSQILPPIEKIELEAVHILSDVTNPLLGEQGATYTYGKQKGADDEELVEIEKGMIHYKQQLSHYFKKEMAERESAGAAGGIAYALMNLFEGKVESGIEFFIDQLKIRSKIEEADLVITGEGKIDQQSFHGKAISKIIDLARKNKKDYLIVCGVSEIPLAELNQDPFFKGLIELQKEAKSIEESIEEGPKVLHTALSHSDFNGVNW